MYSDRGGNVWLLDDDRMCVYTCVVMCNSLSFRVCNGVHEVLVAVILNMGW